MPEKERPTRLPPEAIAQAVKIAVEIADSPEGNVYDFTDTAILPIKRSDVARGGNTPWNTDGLPRNEAYETPLAAPKADVYYGYPTAQRPTWKIEQNAVINHRATKRIAQSIKDNCFSFLVCETKFETMSGTLCQAETKPRVALHVVSTRRAGFIVRLMHPKTSRSRTRSLFGLRHPSTARLPRSLVLRSGEPKPHVLDRHF